MGRLLIVRPLPITAVAATRGTGKDNLLTPAPKEVWADTDTGAATLTFDLGAVRTIDTILLGYVSSPTAAATWSITGGAAGSNEAVIQPATTLRVPDVTGHFPSRTHALWTGAPRAVRYVAVTVSQPAGVAALTAGIVVIGRAFNAELGQEWGSGRQPIDTGTATDLPDGGFSTVEGTRKRSFKWTFGDLSLDEADQLELIALELGETKPGLVIEDAAATTGLHARIHYGLFNRWQAFERRNRRQTRWEVGIRQWV